MFTEQSLSHFKNIWDKDEETFCYCMEILKNKLTESEHYQLMFYYYYINNKFEKAIDFLTSLRQCDDSKQLNLFSTDDDSYDESLNMCSEEACDCCSDCCDDFGCCSGDCCPCCSIGCGLYISAIGLWMICKCACCFCNTCN